MKKSCFAIWWISLNVILIRVVILSTFRNVNLTFGASTDWIEVIFSAGILTSGKMLPPIPSRYTHLRKNAPSCSQPVYSPQENALSCSQPVYSPQENALSFSQPVYSPQENASLLFLAGILTLIGCNF